MLPSQSMNAFVISITNSQLALQKNRNKLQSGQQCVWVFYIEPNVRGFINFIDFY